MRGWDGGQEQQHPHAHLWGREGRARLGHSSRSEVHTGAHTYAGQFRHLQAPGYARVPVCPHLCVFVSMPMKGCTFSPMHTSLWPCKQLCAVYACVSAPVSEPMWKSELQDVLAQISPGHGCA